MKNLKYRKKTRKIIKIWNASNRLQKDEEVDEQLVRKIEKNRKFCAMNCCKDARYREKRALDKKLEKDKQSRGY